MRKSFKPLILLSLLSLMFITAGVSMTIAFPGLTSECGSSGCHGTTTLTISSNATGTVSATVGESFILNVDAGGYTEGDQEFYVGIDSSWADNDQFTFNATSIQDNSAGDHNSNLNDISISVEITPLSLGTHTLRIWTAGKNDVAGSLDIAVSSEYGANAPLIDNPNDIEYEYLETGNRITWLPFDPNPDNYSISRDGTIVGSGGWNGSSISILVDWLIPGVYEYTLTVNNIGGYFASDTVMVSVTLPVTTSGTTTTTTITDTTTTQTTPGGQFMDPAVATPLALVVGTWVVLIVVVIVIVEVLFRKGKW